MITRLDVLEESDVAGGASFGAAGRYVCLTGIAAGLIDPLHYANRNIPGIGYAMRNASGMVEYRAPFMVMRPARTDGGCGGLLYEATNRGKKLAFPYFFGALEQSNTFSDARYLGGALPLEMGYSMLWSGWDATVPAEGDGLVLQAPLVVESGVPLVRNIREEFVSGTRHGVLEQFRLSYDPASHDASRISITARARPGDAARVLAQGEWCFADTRSIVLLPGGRRPEPGWLYEIRYPATNARLLGTGYAATRDLVSFLRHEEAGAQMLGRVAHAVALGISQAGRFLRGYVGRGFNRDERGRRVFEGTFTHVAGAGRVFMDELFGQPSRTRTLHQDHDFPENEFPFSDARQIDPWSGQAAGLLADPECDPLMIQTNTSTEYWQKGASLLHTDPLATRDLVLPERSRAYLLAGTQHDARPGTSADRGPCANPCNPHDPSPVLRALFVALCEWVSAGKEPPSSKVPRIAAGTLVAAEALSFPSWAGLVAPRSCNEVRPLIDWIEPRFADFPYATRVCAVDEDGLEKDGIRTPDLRVPLGTHTGWNCYRAPWPDGQLADRYGSFVPFSGTQVERALAGDPRRSLTERYPSTDAYRDAVAGAVAALEGERLLLSSDAQIYLNRARAWRRP
jgi:hypothetical protein